MENVHGNDNLIASMLTRVCNSYHVKNLLRESTEFQAHKYYHTLGYRDFFKKPTAERIKTEQYEAANFPDTAIEGAGLARIAGSLTKISENSTDMQLDYIFAAHCCHLFHHWVEATDGNLAEERTWQIIKADIELFVNVCIHCMVEVDRCKKPSQFKCIVRISWQYYRGIFYPGEKAQLTI